MKRLMITMGALAFILGGCTEGAGDVQEPVGDSFEDSGGNGGGDNGDGESVDAEEGAELYEANCLQCHGDDMSSGSAPDISGMGAEDVVTAIEEGPGSMPADLVSGDEADAVGAYVESGGE